MILRREIDRSHQAGGLPGSDSVLSSGAADVLLIDGAPAAGLQLPSRAGQRGRRQGFPGL